MAKQYTRTQWNQMQSRLPEGDRVPYEQSPDKAPAYTPDAQDIRDPATGLTPAQVEAQKALTEAAKAGTAAGIPNVIMPGGKGMAGSISTPPATGLKAGYEWYAFNIPGGGFEWRQRPTADTLRGVTQTGPTGPTGDNVPAGTDPALLALLNQLSQQNLQAQLAAQAEADRRAAEAQAGRQSAYDLLYQQFSQYGLGALVEPLKGFITSGISPSEFTIRLRETDAYKKRFAANAARINKGLRALSEAEYIGLEDQYQNIMRRYGLPETYYSRGEMGRQEGFEKFIAGDVSPVELEERLQIGQNRLINAPKEVLDTLKQFYGNEITNGDALAYVVDTEKALENIKRKVAAAEIGAGAVQAGLATGVARAEELGRFGVTGEQARSGYQAIAGFLPRGSQLSEFYKTGPYTQTTAEQEVFGITGATEAAKQRQKLTQLEQAAFSGSSGAAGGALARERAGQF